VYNYSRIEANKICNSQPSTPSGVSCSGFKDIGQSIIDGMTSDRVTLVRTSSFSMDLRNTIHGIALHGPSCATIEVI